MALCYSISPEWSELRGTATGTNVHVFRVSLDIPTTLREHLRSVLSDDESARADRLRDDRLAERFVAGRAALRLLLASYVRARPESIAFEYGPKGKPGLPSAPVQFNLSHSGDMAVIAVTDGEPVGIDIERCRENLDEQRLAGRFFSPGELADLDTLTGQARKDGFYACWTRKEAYMKAVGDGFSIPLRSFRVSLLPTSRPMLLDVPLEPAECTSWELREVEMPEGYRACLAARAPIASINEFDLSWRP